MTVASRLPRLLGVVGSGQMGTGIAQVAATKGINVLLVDADDRALERARANLSRALDRAVARGLDADTGKGLDRAGADAAMARVTMADNLESLHAADFVVEATPENEALKKSIFAALDRVAPPGATLASNTSSISIARIGSATSRPACVVGLHFMNPVPLMPLCEIVPSVATSDATLDAARSLAAAMGKTTILSQDRPGFIVNRILMPMINEAFFALMEGVGTAEDIDKGMKMGTSHPMGPLALADFIGLDTCLSIMRVLHDGTGDSKYRPCPLLVQHVDAGWVGKKAFRGVYTYAEPLN